MRRRQLRQQLVELLELPKDTWLDVARITLLGQEHLVVERHRGLAAFGSTQIAINLPEGRLFISGEGLTLGSITAELITVTGTITGLSLGEGAP